MRRLKAKIKANQVADQARLDADKKTDAKAELEPAKLDVEKKDPVGVGKGARGIRQPPWSAGRLAAPATV